MDHSSEERNRFYENFTERFGEVILEIEMANIMASDKVLEKMNLHLPEGVAAVWGLLVFCQSKKVYFYVHPSESMMSAMMRVARQGEGPKEQMLCFSDLKNFRILERTKRWYDFFNPDAKFQIEAEFESEGEKMVFVINTQKKAELIVPKF